jgi:predicted metal-dependent hydrolase
MRSGASMTSEEKAARPISRRWASCVPATGITIRLKPMAPMIAPMVLAA